MDRALAISVAAASTLQDQVRLAQQGEQQLQRALGAARHDFASELDELRADGKLAQERLKAAKTRALLEIERERQSAARLQKDLDTVTRKAEQGVSRHREEVQKLQAQVGDLHQQLGVLERNLNALRTTNARYIDETARPTVIVTGECEWQKKSSPSIPAAKLQANSGTKRTPPRTPKA